MTGRGGFACVASTLMQVRHAAPLGGLQGLPLNMSGDLKGPGVAPCRLQPQVSAYQQTAQLAAPKVQQVVCKAGLQSHTLVHGLPPQGFC